MTAATTLEPGLLGVGHEGQTIDSFLSELLAMGVSRLVDVRLTPVSRKRGFSKSALAQALAGAGISYEHRRELGNPKVNRAGFGGTPEGGAHPPVTAPPGSRRGTHPATTVPTRRSWQESAMEGLQDLSRPEGRLLDIDD